MKWHIIYFLLSFIISSLHSAEHESHKFSQNYTMQEIATPQDLEPYVNLYAIGYQIVRKNSTEEKKVLILNNTLRIACEASYYGVIQKIGNSYILTPFYDSTKSILPVCLALSVPLSEHNHLFIRHLNTTEIQTLRELEKKHYACPSPEKIWLSKKN